MLAVALIAAAITWLADGLHQKILENFFKPATLIAIIIAAYLLTQGPHDEWQAPFFLAGLVFSLAGDVFLMLPEERFFLPGLVSFLVAHLCYIAGLNSSFPSWPSPLLLIPIAAIGAALFRGIAKGLSAKRKTSLIAPVAVYSLVISLMLLSAWATIWRPDWTTSRRLLVIAGATLFFASDSMLAWNRFVRLLPTGNIGVLVTYHIGQIALAASIAQ